jgi:hypothetical protein
VRLIKNSITKMKAFSLTNMYIQVKIMSEDVYTSTW